jgi:hypothetical protein
MKWSTVILSVLILSSCTAKQKVPKKIIPLSKAPAVFWDVMQADALVRNKALVDTGFRRMDTSIKLYSQVLQIHKVTQEQFRGSIKYYQSRPDLLQIIFDSLQHRTDAATKATVDSAKTQ